VRERERFAEISMAERTTGTTKKAPAKAAGRTAAKGKATEKASKPPATEKRPRVYGIPFASVYPLYLEKAAKKGRTKEEVDEVIGWLTGYTGARLQKVIDERADLQTFFDQAPRMNPNAALITGVVCGVRIEELTDPLMRKIRWLDKLVDELARGKKMASILRV
jgi:hypothetical protein